MFGNPLCSTMLTSAPVILTLTIQLFFCFSIKIIHLAKTTKKNIGVCCPLEWEMCMDFLINIFWDINTSIFYNSDENHKIKIDINCSITRTLDNFIST